MNDHFLSTYDEELQEVRGIVLKMGDLAKEQLTEAMQALAELDRAKAANVRTSDKELDALEVTAERTVIGIFARRSPVADDLREVLCALKMTTMIERIGDYAKNIAKRTMAIADGSMLIMPQVLDEMSNNAEQMIQHVMDAYLNRDVQEALKVWESDEALDSLHNKSYRRILARMMERPEHINELTHYLMIAKNLETHRRSGYKYRRTNFFMLSPAKTLKKLAARMTRRALQCSDNSQKNN